MADYNSSLPVRTESNGDVVAFLADGTTPSQLLAIDASGRVSSKLFDGAGTAITSQVNGTQQALDVGINVAGVQIDPRQIRALTNADVVTAEQGTSPWVISGTVTANQGGAWTVAATQSGTWSVGLTEDHNYGAVGANTLRTASQIGNATGSANFGAGATGAQTLRVESNQGAPGTAANGWFVKITDGTNTQTVTAGGAAVVEVSNLPTTVDTDYGVVGANTIRTAAQIGNATGAADFNSGATGAQTLRVAANIEVAGAPATLLNPVPVVITDSTPGTPINDYDTTAAVAAGATDNHDYTVTAAKTLYLNQIETSGSGKIKIEVQIETAAASGIFNTKWVKFNSTADTGISIHIENPIPVVAGARVRIIRTNRDNQSQDLYSTISGYELP